MSHSEHEILVALRLIDYTDIFREHYTGHVLQ